MINGVSKRKYTKEDAKIANAKHLCYQCIVNLCELREEVKENVFTSKCTKFKGG